MSMSMKIKRIQGATPDPRITEASIRVKNACDKNGIKFLESGTPDNIIEVIDSGARIVAGQSIEAAKIGRRHTNRKMKV